MLAQKTDVDHNIHDQLAMKLCTEALRFPDSSESKAYLKALLQLSMSFSNPSHTRDLHSLTRKLLRKVKDKAGLKLIEQFDALVQKHLVQTAVESADSAVDETEMESPSPTPAVPSSTTPKPRIRQLGSKHGTTLLMERTGFSDAEMSQNSDAFFSPPSTSTQSENKSDKSSEEVAIEVDSRYFI